MKRALVVLIAALLQVAASAPSLSASTKEETKVLQAAQDNTLIESPTGELSNGRGPVIFVGRTGQAQGSIRRGLIVFDINESLPAGSKITSVKLTLHVKLSAGGARALPVSLFRVMADWGEGSSNSAGGRGAPASEGDATWIHTFYPKSNWSRAGGDYASAESAAQTVNEAGVYTWQSTPRLVADVQGWLDSPKENFGWILIGDETTAGTAKVIDSRESAESASCPQLTVTFKVPDQPTKPKR